MLKELLFTKQSPVKATAEDIAAVESKLGMRFPSAFIEFCSMWNGGYTNEKNEFYPVPQSFEEFYQEYGTRGSGILAGVLFGVTNHFPQCSLITRYSELNAYGDLGIIPISEDLFGNQVALRIDSPEGLVYWRDHELWEMPESPGPGPHVAGNPHLIPIAPNLEFFYNSLTCDQDAGEREKR